MNDQRRGEAIFAASVSPPEDWEDGAVWFIFRHFDLLLPDGTDQSDPPHLKSPEELGLKSLAHHYLGSTSAAGETIHYFAADLGPEADPPPGMAFVGLRAAYSRLNELDFQIAGQAVQVVNWDRTHQYCGRCGQATENSLTERAKVCPECGLRNYPRISPAMIVRVQRINEKGEAEILLARNRRFPSGFYSVLAGFVEPGESLEGCVRREVLEEVGLHVGNIAYFGSQPWPFPHSLMIAFVADYEGGMITVDDNELDEASWFTRDALPHYPPPPSIANRLIESWRGETVR